MIDNVELTVEELVVLEMHLAFGVDVTVADKPQNYRAADKPQDYRVADKPQDYRVADKPQDYRVADKPQGYRVVERPPSLSNQQDLEAPKSLPVHEEKPIYKAQPVKKPQLASPKLLKPTSAIPLARAEAEKIAASIQTLQELKTAVERFDGCGLKAMASQVVFGVGVENPTVMVIGEGPGAEEDRRGVPLSGASGRMLQRCLEIIGLRTADNLYISNTVYWRPPADRTPTETEIATCLPFLCRQIELLQPKVLLLAGARAAQTLLGRSSGITRLRGGWCETNPTLFENPIPCLPIFHPAYLFRNHGQKRLLWQDILLLRTYLDDHHLDIDWPDNPLVGFKMDWRV